MLLGTLLCVKSTIQARASGPVNIKAPELVQLQLSGERARLEHERSGRTYRSVWLALFERSLFPENADHIREKNSPFISEYHFLRKLDFI